MPTYDLSCKACGNDFELFLMRVIRDGDGVCPACGSHDVKTGIGGGFLGAGTKSGQVGACGAPVSACETGGG